MQRRHIHNPSKTTNKAYIVETTLLPPTSPTEKQAKNVLLILVFALESPLASKEKKILALLVIQQPLCDGIDFPLHCYTHTLTEFTHYAAARKQPPLLKPQTQTCRRLPIHHLITLSHRTLTVYTIQGARLYHPPSSNPMRVLNVCVSGNELLSC